MNLDIIETIPWSRLERMIRSVPLMAPDENGEKIFPYQDARICLRTAWPGELNLTTKYLLRSGLALQEDLRAALRDLGYDPLQLAGGLRLHNRDADEEWTLIPPIVEMMLRDVTYVPGPEDIAHEDVVRIALPGVNDGAHRVWLARTLDRPINVVSISGIPLDHPFYAHPNAWNVVRVLDAVPCRREEKKLYVRDDAYALYRDFGVLGCGAPRPLGSSLSVVPEGDARG